MLIDMDEDIRKEPKRSIFDDSSNAEPILAVKPAEPEYEDFPHPKAVSSTVPVISTDLSQTTTNSEPKIHYPGKKPIYAGIITTLVVLAVIGATTYFRRSTSDKKTAEAIKSQQASPVSIAIYHTKNLPEGYTYNNDSKTLKTDVLYFSISGPNQSLFYVTQQPIPANFDFVAFNKKFATPDTFNTASGTVTAGPVGGNMLASIRTSKNTWIIINSSATATQAQLETVARAFELEQ